MNESNQTIAATAAARLKLKAHDAVERVGASAEEIEEDIRSRAKKAAESVARTEQRIVDGAGTSARQARGYVVANPLIAAGMAFAAGAVISAVLRR